MQDYVCGRFHSTLTQAINKHLTGTVKVISYVFIKTYDHVLVQDGPPNVLTKLISNLKTLFCFRSTTIQKDIYTLLFDNDS